MTQKTNEKFGKLFAKKKKQTAKVKLVDNHDQKQEQTEIIQTPAKVDVNNKQDQPEQVVKQAKKQESTPQPEKKQRKAPNFNWFADDQESEGEQIPDAGLDLIKDQKQIQSQKKKQEANKMGQEYWDHEDIQGVQSLEQKKKNKEKEKELLKKKQEEILNSANDKSKEFFAAYSQQFFNGSVRPNQTKNAVVKLADDEFISLEEQTQMAKIGKKKAAALNSIAKASQNTEAAQQVAKAIKPQQSKYKNQFRDLGGDRDSDDEQEKKKQSKKFIIGDKKPGEDFQKKQFKGQDKGWKKGTGQVEIQDEQKKFKPKKQDSGFKLGGGTIQKPRFQSKENEGQVTFSRQAFGSGQVEQQPERPFKKRQFEGRQNGAGKGFNRQKFGTGKIQARDQKPRKHLNGGGDDRKSKNDTWAKGVGKVVGGGGVPKKSDFKFRDNNKKVQKQEVQAQTESKTQVKKEAAVLVNEDKDENCWDLDL